MIARGPLAVAAITACTLVIAARFALPDRPPLAHTGGFGERTCQECHNDNPLNDPAGSLRLLGIPEAYEAGHAYTLTISLARKDLGRAGFEMAARVAEGPQAGHQGGGLEATDARVNIGDSAQANYGPVHYARHTAAGSSANSDTTQWTVKWTAPATGTGAVIFHLVANAGNDDNSPLGDYIYSTTATSKSRP